ncbi:MAG: PEGA domain-containing protein [Myxococcaceae bacterium]
MAQTSERVRGPETLRRVLALVTAAIFLTNCATVFKGSSEKATLSSDPPSATVFLNGLPIGKTPTEVLLDSKNAYNLEFRKDGYEPRVVVVTHFLGAGWMVVDLLFLLALVPIIVDAATGDWYYLQPTTVHAVLEPVAAKPGPTAPLPSPAAPPATPGS